MAFPFDHSCMGEGVLKSIVTYALSRLDVHICPRIKMSDAVVLEAFPDDLEVGLGFCYCKKCNMLESQISKCTMCDSTFQFVLEQSKGGVESRVLELVTSRYLGHFEDVSDPKWLSQIAYPY